MVPLTIRHALRNVNSDLCSLISGGEHKFDSFVLNSKGDKIMFSIESSIVEEQSRVLNGCKFQLQVEFEPLGEGG